MARPYRQGVASLDVPTSSYRQLSHTLSGKWVAAVPDEELLRVFSNPDHDDRDWAEIEVPGHWRDEPQFSDAEQLLYRHRFTMERAKSGRRRWLVVDGLFYQGDIWLDGSYLGDTEGYFAPHVFEVTEQLESTRDHVLAIEATCWIAKDLTAKRNITGILQHWDNIDPALNPGGLWRTVRIEETGPVRIETLRVTVAEADAGRAIVQFHATLDTVATHTVTVRTLIDQAGDTEGHGEVAVSEEGHLLSTGRNVLEWRIAVENPQLWWPHSLGEQPLYDIRVEVMLAGAASHVRKRRTGLRRVELKNWIASINGERLFLKGTNFGPGSIDLASLTAEDHRRDLILARDASLDLVRVHAHVTQPEFYREADKLGILLWQDFPLQWGYERGIRAQAARQAEAMVDLLSHHPSVILWCGHNEPVPLDARPGHRPDAEPTNRFMRRGVVQQELPSWNRTVLDRTVKRTISRADPSRPVIAHSGVLPHPPQLDGTDSHLYFGWFQGDVNGLAALATRIPRMVRFVSEFGAQSVPEHGSLADPDRWPHLDWSDLAETSGLQLEVMEQRVPTEGHATYESWAAATRAYQAQVVRVQIETLRKLKYKPTGGFCQHFFADPTAMISSAVLDHERCPKEPAFSALSAACRPVIVVADPLAPGIVPGVENKQAIHVVSDLRDAIDDAEVEVVLRWPRSTRTWKFAGPIEPDSVVRVGEILWTIPRGVGPVTLDLHLQASTINAHNRYESSVVR